MSPHLALHFLGIPQLNLDDTPITTDRRKAVALLAYLAVGRGKYTREFLSGFFWPDYDQSKAFSNLRRTIWEVHQVLGENWLIADRESVWLNSETEIELDVARFEDLIVQSHEQIDAVHRISLLTEAAKLYRNHFLTGFSLKDAFPFNEWAYAESEELRRQLAEALSILSEDYCALGEVDKAIPFARRLIALDPLNESAHRQLMEIYIQAGQHSAALKQYQTCEQILRKELNLDPQPETRALYKKIRTRKIESTHVEKQFEPITPKHNLPSSLSTFIGRERERNEIIHLLVKNRLVTLAGIGGIGKTRLALEVGQAVLHDYPDGVWFIPLDSLSNPALVPQAIASIFDIREGSQRPVIEILKNVLRQKTALLILDNCEHLLEGCAQLITALLTNCPNLKLLATSREILNMEGEAAYYLPSLSIPSDGVSLEKLINYEAVQLFSDRASLALTSFMLTNENAPTVIEICHKVDGIPLAIELAAARINIFHEKEILNQLNESFALLTSDGRRTLPRQQTLQASMDWSWGLLNELEQRFLQQLSVFAGGWTLESAQAVCDGDVLSLTSGLVKKSLIRVDQKSENDTRYRFHEIVRQYAYQKLVEAGEEQNVRTQHLKYFLKLSEEAEIALRGAEQVKWFSRIFDERDNIRAVLVWAGKTFDVETGLYILGRLDRFWDSFDMREGSSWLGEFLRKPESKAFPVARAKALCTQGWLLQWMQLSSEARSAAQECLDIYRACGDKEGEVESLILLGFISEAPKSLELSLQALALARSLGDTWRQAKAFAFLGWTDSYDFKSRVGHWEKAIDLFRKTDDVRFLAGQLATLGYFFALNGDIESAQKCLDESTLLQQQLDAKNFTSKNVTGGYAQIALIRGDYEQARALWQSMEIFGKESGDRMLYLWIRARLAYLDLREGNISEARQTLLTTAQSFKTDESTIGVIFTLEGMAEYYVAVDRPNIAARLIGWADATREKIADTRPSLEQADVDKIITACIIKMGEAAFSDSYDEGQKMSMDQAVALALNEH